MKTKQKRIRFNSALYFTVQFNSCTYIKNQKLYSTYIDPTYFSTQSNQNDINRSVT